MTILQYINECCGVTTLQLSQRFPDYNKDEMDELLGEMHLDGLVCSIVVEFYEDRPAVELYFPVHTMFTITAS